MKHPRAVLDNSKPVCRGDLAEGDELVPPGSPTDCPACLGIIHGAVITYARRKRDRA